MARLDIRGLDRLIDDLRKLGDDAKEIAEGMVLEAGEVMKEEWIREIEQQDLVDKGDMIGSVGYPPRTEAKINQRQIDTYPRGKNRRGIRNAEVAFIHHYGAPRKKIRARYFVDTIETESEEAIPDRIYAVYDEELKKRGF